MPIRRISVFTCRRPILHPWQSQQASQHTRTGEGILQVQPIETLHDREVGGTTPGAADNKRCRG